jgi:hypothetical protein
VAHRVLDAVVKLKSKMLAPGPAQNR